MGDAFADSLRQQTNGLNIGTYGVNYSASKLQIHTGDGANDVISHVKSMASSCPSTKIVLGGYSQGADVIDIVSGVPIGGINWGSSLPPELANNVVVVRRIEGQEHLAEHLAGDILRLCIRAGGSITTQSAMFASKAIDLCNPNDPICHAGQGNEWSGHTEGYVPVYTTQAAAFVASKLMAGSGQQVPGFGPSIQTPGPGTPGYGGPELPGPQAPGPGTSIHGPTSPAPDLVAAFH